MSRAEAIQQPDSRGLERDWNRPNLTTQEPMEKQLMTITHTAADLRGISLANVASWDGDPSKTSQIVSFFLIENWFRSGFPA